MIKSPIEALMETGFYVYTMGENANHLSRLCLRHTDKIRDEDVCEILPNLVAIKLVYDYVSRTGPMNLEAENLPAKTGKGHFVYRLPITITPPWENRAEKNERRLAIEAAWSRYIPYRKAARDAETVYRAEVEKIEEEYLAKIKNGR